MNVDVDSTFAELLSEWFDLLEQENLHVRFTSGFRDLAEQRALFARQGSRGLAAQPGRSYHNYGLALDFVADTPTAQTRAGTLAESVGLRWGGRFRPPDVVHIDAGNFLPIEEAETQGYPVELVTLEE